ncbi:proteasome assembly chaperone 2 [Vanessa cardui]|uniref:proteasome assembly chaperone 2 n=1 Tax=Vanessa cardui TaxID=171605 RepID=UPI001F12EC7C|nr:proteasome assembly chaperone 2 [Vanessa cardui]
MDKSTIWKFCDENPLNEYTLIVPSVAVGNVGQLSCDLLISSLSMVKIASVYSTAQIPVIGSDPYNLKSGCLSTSCEIYKSVSKKVCVLQLKSPLIFKYAKKFLEEVIEIFKEKFIKDVIILSSSYAHEKKHILSSPFRYVISEGSSYADKIRNADIVKHEDDTGELKIFGGGFASLLYKICQESNIPCLVLYKYCSEGDNIPDAYDMIKILMTVCPLFSEETDLFTHLKQPVSWTLLFGRPPPQNVY